MVERLSALVALAFSAFSASGVVFSQGGLPDPTRPPAPPTSASVSDSATSQAPRAAHQLQSILISSTRRLAVIDGRTVPLGGEFSGATVTSITEAGVTLRRGKETETLRLNPAVRLTFHPPPGEEATESTPTPEGSN